MDRYARENNISRKNISELARFHDNYHGNAYGLTHNITEDDLQNAGFTFKTRVDYSDYLPAYNEITTIHKSIITQWPDPNDISRGPQVHRIITKYLSAFPTLHSTSGRAWIDFYDKMQTSGTSYILPLTPFDSIIDVTDYTYLYPPLLGTKRYAACATAMLALLVHIIPPSLSNTLNVLINTVQSESGNGYDLFHRALKTFVPGFDKSRPLPLPYWMDGTTVHDFSTSIVIYFRIQALHQMPRNDYEKSLTFLRGITGSEYTELTHTLISTVENYYLDNGDGENGWLPERLRIPGLAIRLNDYAIRRMTAENQYSSTEIVPYAHRIAINNLPFDASYPEDQVRLQYSDMPHHNDNLLQPSSHRTFNSTPDTDRRMNNTRQSRGGVRFQDTNHPTNGINPPPSSTGANSSSQGRPSNLRRGGRSTSRGRPFPDPNRNRRPFVNQQCPACGKVGHTWQNCDMLAMAITINHFMDGQASSGTLQSIESDWLNRHRARLQQDSRSPRQVLRAYADNNQISEDDIELQLDWSAWDDDETTAGDVAQSQE
jgi:hypothetical protein